MLPSFKMKKEKKEVFLICQTDTKDSSSSSSLDELVFMDSSWTAFLSSGKFEFAEFDWVH